MSVVSRFPRRLWRRLSLILVLCSLAVLAVCLLLNAVIVSQGKKKILSGEALAAYRADCVLVLGAGVRDDGSPSHMLEDRLRTAIPLYGQAAPKLLMSGDHGRVGYNEVGTMKRFAVEAGVAESDVFMDHAGFSTYESLYRARDVFGVKKVVIVTQEYHLYRALYIADQLGLEAVGVSADVRMYRGQFMREVREGIARVKDALWCVLRPEPTYLGDVIPIHGDGNATNDDAYAAMITEDSST